MALLTFKIWNFHIYPVKDLTFFFETITKQRWFPKSNQVHHKFDLQQETLFLTVNLIDRFLAKQSVVRKKLQLVGLVAMLLACKYEEVSVPVVDDLVFISDKAYSRTEILEMVLKFYCFFIDFDLVLCIYLLLKVKRSFM